ncbi:hypothetical protein Q7Z90_07910 [Glaesserella parasuis]|nr:hypothetical protein [Glaesserella parasuis]MDP0328729.1 hypothetical protein [Glaesserella parasuis]MDP0391309.1 hypothetical protein [Glaesserella parasuis]
MANELAIGLVIGAALKGSFIAAFGKARKTIDELGNGLGKAMQTQEKLSSKIAKSQEKQIALQQKISKAYLTGDENVAKLVRRYEKVQASISKAVEKQQLFTKAIKRSEAAQQTLSKAVERQEQRKAHRDELKGKIFNSTAATAAVAMPVWSSVKTFIEQEESANNLKIAMMKADGTIGKFNGIGKIAGELGKDLPGTRKDFYQLAEALKKTRYF